MTMKHILLLAIILVSFISAKPVGNYAMSQKLAPGGNYRIFAITVKPTTIDGKKVCAYTGRLVINANRDGSCDRITLHHLSRVRPSKADNGSWNGLYCGYDYTTDGPLMHTNVLRQHCPDIIVMKQTRIIDTLYYGENDKISDYYADGDDPVYPEFYYNQSVLNHFPVYRKQVDFMERAGLLIRTLPY